MDPYSSGEKLNTKTRKPYTITKQRERWTEDEHNSFLEALKLYGRAWQRIEEHIGTKTAVQIRSHAQKFFTKLEKEAVAKGVPIRQALDMEIPPPRPKRKPNYPYPRKTHPEVAGKDGKQTTLHSGKCILDLETKPLAEATEGDEKLENEQVENGGEEAPCVSLSSENENPISRPSCTFREFIPAMEDVSNHGETNQSYITIETRKHHKSGRDGIIHTNVTSNTLFVGNSHLFQENIVEGEICDKQNDVLQQGVQNYPRHVPVQIVDGNQGPEMSCQESTLVNIAPSGYSSYQTVPTFHPLLTHPTISSLIVSSLLQNPAAHAAASFAATFWQTANTEASSSSSRDEAPSMAAIAAATVAAATAWWAAHGLLPFYSSCTTSPFSFGTPIHGNEKENKQTHGGLPKEHPPSKSSSSEDSDGGGGKLKTAAVEEAKEMTPAAETNVGKQVDRSSCGSNTTSSSEIETDGLEKKHRGKEKEESKKESDDVNRVLPCNNNDSLSRRSRSCITTNESWKEVSEEGRLAFQALFSQQVLPQSFTHRQSNNNNNNNNNSVVTEKDQELDLNKVTYSTQGQGEEGLLTVKLNVHHTGFKPYKRCSIESKKTSTSTVTQNDDKGPKRMRLDSST